MRHLIFLICLTIISCTKTDENIKDYGLKTISSFSEYKEIVNLNAKIKNERVRLVFEEPIVDYIEGKKYMIFNFVADHEEHTVSWRTYAIPFDKSDNVLIFDPVDLKFLPRETYNKKAN